jgi:hypothetical protein
LVLLRHILEPDGARKSAARVKPRPLALGRVQVQTKRRTSSLQDPPHVLEQLHIAHNATIVHVPLVVHWIQSCNLVHKPVDAATKVQGAKRVALLNPRARLDDVLVIVEQHRRLPITPLRPVRHGWKHAVDCLDKMVSTDLVESVAKINLQKP